MMAATEARRAARAAPDFPHGTAGYGYGCRCDRCRVAVRDYRRARRQAGHDPGWRKDRWREKPGRIMRVSHEVANSRWWKS